MSNIVDAYPREGIVFRTKPLFQWDWGQIVRLHISDLPASYKVEFSNSTRADAVSTVQTTDEVTVPAQFLESGNPVYAWVVVVDYARTTEYSLIIPVSARAKPTDLEPSPEEHSEIEQAIAALNGAVEQTAADVETAGGYAEEAEQSAEAAATASEAAINAKNTAETKASESATAAQNASTSAAQASTSAQNAASSASAATTAKNAAESAAESVAGAMATLEATIQADLQAAKESGEFDGKDGQDGKDGADGFSPTAAVNKAGGTSTITITDKNGITTATVNDGKDGVDGSPGAPGTDGTTFTPAVSAEGVISWTNDGGKINPQPVNIKGPQGGDYVLTTADKAEIAQLAEELLAPALDSKAPVVYNAASGAIASFTDGADDMPLKNCVVQIEPVQDLHGYDSPWPAGGGKNKFYTTNVTESGTTVNGVTFTRQTDGTVKAIGSSESADFRVLLGSITLAAGTYTVSGAIDGTKRFRLVNGQDALIAHESGSGASFTLESDTTVTVYIRLTEAVGTSINATFKPMICLSSASNPTTYAPYSNICPITGWTGAKVTRTGKNLLKPYPAGATKTQVGITGTQNADGSITFDGTSTGTFWGIGDSPTFLLKTGTYTIQQSEMIQNVATVLVEYVEGGDNLVITTIGADSYRTFTIDHDCMVYFYNRISSGVTLLNKKYWVWLVEGSTPTPYEPYQGYTYDITFPTEAGTVYGGTMDVVRGVLTVDRAVKVFTGASTERWYKSSDYRYFAVPQIADAVNRNANPEDFQSNKYAYGMIANGNTTLGGCLIWAGVRVRLPDMSISLDDWQSRLSAEPLQVVYRLATPITYQLTPQEIKTLLGTNNIWADTGDTYVEYCADTKAYVDESLPDVPVQDVQVNGTSILSNGVANVPVAYGELGVVSVATSSANCGLYLNSSNGGLVVHAATSDQIKLGTQQYRPIAPTRQHESTFYGLAKAAGADMANSSNAVGNYTESAKSAIQTMIGISGIIAPVEGATASKTYAIGDAFLHGGALYKVSAVIAAGDAIVPGTNCTQTTIIEMLKGA